MKMLRTVAILKGVILIAACTAVQNSPQQDLVWSAYNQCKVEGRIPTNVQLVRVEPDGRAWYSTYSSAYGAQQLERCMTDRIAISSMTAPTPVFAPVLSP